MREGNSFRRDSQSFVIHVYLYCGTLYSILLLQHSNAIEILLFSKHTHRYICHQPYFEHFVCDLEASIWQVSFVPSYHKLCLLLREFSIAPHSLYTPHTYKHMAASISHHKTMALAIQCAARIYHHTQFITLISAKLRRSCCFALCARLDAPLTV